MDAVGYLEEMSILELQGILPENVIAVCKYKPSTGKPRPYYYKKIIRKITLGGPKYIHVHIRKKDVPQVLEAWERTLRYRDLARRYARMTSCYSSKKKEKDDIDATNHE